MLATLLIWLYTFILLFSWGSLTVDGLARLFQLTGSTRPSFPLTCLVGLAAVTTLASFLSLFAHIGLLANVLLLAGALTFLFRERRAMVNRLHGWQQALRTLHPLTLVLIALTLLTVLETATHKPAAADTGLYHAQAIHWIETYPAVPGLGNLQSRFAYNSSWFVSNALFSLAFLGSRSFHLTSSVLFLITVLFFLSGIGCLLQGDRRASVVLKTALFPLATALLISGTNSPATDLPSAVMVWIVFILWAETIEEHPLNFSWNEVVMVVLSVFAVTIKLSSAALLLVPGWLLLQRLRRRDFHRPAAAAALAVLLLSPWLARNLILSGYPVFPGFTLDLFHLDWRIPAEQVRAEQVSVEAFARNPQLPAEVVAAMPLQQWVPLWFNRLTANRRVVMLAVASGPAVLLLAGLATLALGRKNVFKTAAGWLPLYLAAYGGALAWFFTAPAYRFGYGFVIICLMLVALPWFRAALVGSAPRLKILPVLVVAALIAFQALSLVQSIELRSLPDRLLLPADYVNLPTQTCQLRNIRVFCPSQWNDCGYSAFPCTPNPDPRVGLRGKDWADGFNTVRP